MKKMQLITMLCLLLSGSVLAQQATPTVICSGGGVLKTSDGVSLSYTIGEPAFTLLSGSNASLSQGFEAPYIWTLLPLHLLNFGASLRGNEAVVKWRTTNEINVGYYAVQSSTDGQNFTQIGKVMATGGGDYSYTDTRNLSGTIYYRLQSVDKDGDVSYSKVVNLSFTVRSTQFTIYPNPTKDNITIEGSHIASVQIISNTGKVVSVHTLLDATNPSISVVSLPVTTYHLRIQTTDGKVNLIDFVKE